MASIAPGAPAPSCEETPQDSPIASPAPESDARREANIKKARAYFGADRFATQQCGACIDAVDAGHAVCSFDIAAHHRNAMGNVMGGAIFTLADFALAVASNFEQGPAVSVSSSIEFIAGVKGTRLVATCDADRSGKHLGFYTVRVEDDLGTLVALVQATCMRV